MVIGQLKDIQGSLIKCGAIVKSCKKYGVSNSLNGCKDEVLFGGRKVQMIKKKVFNCSDENFKGFYDQYKCCTVLPYCWVHISEFELQKKRKWGEAEKVKQSPYRPGYALRVPGGTGSQISKQLANQGGKVASPMH